MEKKQKITLNDIEKKKVFDVPNAYFENLPSKIADRLPAVQQKASFFSASWVKYSVSLACIGILVFCAYVWFLIPQPANEQPMTEVSEQEIVEYLQQADISSYDLMEAASSAGVSIRDDLSEEAIINAELLMDEADNSALDDFI